MPSQCLEFSTILLAVFLLVTSPVQAGEAPRSPNDNPLADLQQTVNSNYVGHDELITIGETVKFSVEGTVLVVTRLGRKKTLGTKSDEIRVADEIRTFRAELTELSRNIEIQNKWKSFFNSTISGTKHAAVRLTCRIENCVEQTRQSVTTCVFGCVQKEPSAPTTVTKRLNELQIPTAGKSQAHYVAERLGLLVTAAGEMERPGR